MCFMNLLKKVVIPTLILSLIGFGMPGVYAEEVSRELDPMVSPDSQAVVSENSANSASSYNGAAVNPVESSLGNVSGAVAEEKKVEEPKAKKSKEKSMKKASEKNKDKTSAKESKKSKKTKKSKKAKKSKKISN